MFNQETITQVIPILLAVGMILSTIGIFIITILLFKMKQTQYNSYCKIIDMQDKVTEIYYNTRKMTTTIDDNHRLLTELSESLPQLVTTPTTESTDTIRKLPTPELEEQITATIKDQIATEVALSSGLRSPYKDSLRDIVLRTVETYPDIDIEYLVRKVVSLIEMYSK